MGSEIKKDIYICATYFHIFVSAVRVSLSNTPSDILIESIVPCAQGIMFRLEKSGLFQNVIYFDRAKVSEYRSRSRICKLLFEHWYNKNIFKQECDVKFADYNKIYIYNDRTVVSRHVYDLKLNYILLEDGADFFTNICRVSSKDTIRKNVLEMVQPPKSLKKKIARKLGYGYQALGQSEFCTQIVVTKNENLFIPQNGKILELPLSELVNQLDSIKRRKIFECFFDDDTELYNLEKQRGYALVLTTPLFQDGFLKSKEEHIKLYQRIVEEYQDKGYQVCIKPHPRDDIDYASHYNGVVVFNRLYPIEALSLSNKRQFDVAITVVSSAVFTLPIAKEVVYLGYDYITANCEQGMIESNGQDISSISITPVFKENAISLVLTSLEGDIGPLSVVLQSIIENTTFEHNYDIVLMLDTTRENKQSILHQAENHPNISVRFFDKILRLPDNHKLRSNKEMWYKFYVPYIIEGYEKTLYMDTDAIVLDDIARLFQSDLDNDVMIGAIRNPSIKRNTETCFQDGILLINNTSFKKKYSLNQMVEVCDSQQYINENKSVLGFLVQDSFKMLDDEWNVIYPESEYNQLKDGIYLSFQDKSNGIESKPRIISFKEKPKPWISTDIEFAYCFWEYARKTPFYELMILKAMKQELENVQRMFRKKRKFLVFETINQCFPKGTVRREIIKKPYSWIKRLSEKIYNRH